MSYTALDNFGHDHVENAQLWAELAGRMGIFRGTIMCKESALDSCGALPLSSTDIRSICALGSPSYMIPPVSVRQWQQHGRIDNDKSERLREPQTQYRRASTG